MKRQDGRTPDALRKISIERGFVKYAEGSCLITVGNTKVIVASTVEEKVPAFLKGQNEGWITCEYAMLPRATQNRLIRDRVYARNMEIQRLIGRSLRSIVNQRELGERTIRIDCDVIQADGGTRTASIIGGFVALADCLSGLRKSASILRMPVTDMLGAISVGVLQGEYLLDLNYHEDCAASVDMNVVMKGNGEFVEVQGTAEKGSFSKKDLDELLTLAKKGISDIIDMQRNLLKDVISNI